MQYHLLDDTHIEILAGDIPKGLWNFASDRISISRDDESVPLAGNTKSVEIRLKRQVGRLDTLSNVPVSGVMGMVLGQMYGPTGGLVGQAVGLVAGKAEYMCIGAQLKDGRKFIARMRDSVFHQWCKACPEAKKIEREKENKGMFGLGLFGL